MRIVICVFSGTGNTRLLAGTFAGALRDRGQEVTELSLDGLGERLPGEMAGEIGNCDLLGIAYPVHAFNAPANVLRFARLLPPGNNRPVFLLKSSGEPLRLNDVSSLKLMSILRRRGYAVRGEYHYCMPYNIIFRHSDAMARRMLDTAQAIIPLDVAELLAGVPRLPRRHPLGGLAAWIMRIEHWGGRLNGRFYSVTEDCVLCGRCVRSCPAGNIQIKDGTVKFGGKCLMCMRCAQGCPKNALRIGLFESWKVNGGYSFREPGPGEPVQEYNRLLTRAYDRYFREAEGRLDEQRSHTERIP